MTDGRHTFMCCRNDKPITCGIAKYEKDIQTHDLKDLPNVCNHKEISTRTCCYGLHKTLDNYQLNITIYCCHLGKWTMCFDVCFITSLFFSPIIILVPGDNVNMHAFVLWNYIIANFVGLAGSIQVSKHHLTFEKIGYLHQTSIFC